MIPSYISKLPNKQKAKWSAIYGHVKDSYGSEQAMVSANTWLNSQLKPIEVIARSENSREMISFKIDTTELIKRSEDGEEYVTAVLTTTDTHKDGERFTEDVLKSFADSINKEPLVSDVDHKLYDELLDSTVSTEGIMSMLKAKTGIAKTVKAIYEKGKLFVRLMIDKRYRNQIKNAKGMSVEAIINNRKDGAVSDASLLGLTFNINSNPAVPNTGIVN